VCDRSARELFLWDGLNDLPHPCLLPQGRR
jgi:hypothetical protein